MDNQIYHSACIRASSITIPFIYSHNQNIIRVRIIRPSRWLNSCLSRSWRKGKGKELLPSIFPPRFISHLGARHRDLEPLSTSTLSAFAPFYPRLLRKRRCSSRAPLLGMHRALERERERRGEGGGGWSSWFAASVINVRALEASLDHIAFVINRFGGSLGLRRHYVLYVSLQISFSVVRGPCTYVHDHSHALPPSPPFRAAGIGKKERRIYRGTMASGQGKSECSLTARRILILVTHTYPPAGSRKRMEEELFPPCFSSFSIRTTRSLAWSIARITNVLNTVFDRR